MKKFKAFNFWVSERALQERFCGIFPARMKGRSVCWLKRRVRSVASVSHMSLSFDDPRGGRQTCSLEIEGQQIRSVKLIIQNSNRSCDILFSERCAERECSGSERKFPAKQSLANWIRLMKSISTLDLKSCKRQQSKLWKRFLETLLHTSGERRVGWTVRTDKLFMMLSGH